MVRNDGSTTLRAEGKRHVLDHLGRVIFHLSSPRPHFSPFPCQFQWKISKSIRKEAKQQPALPRRVSLFLRRPAAACFSLSRNKLKRAKSPMLQGFSHALVRFGGKQKAPERSPRCPHLHLVHFAPLIPGPPAYEFCVFSHERGHRSSVDFTTKKWPRPPVGVSSGTPGGCLLSESCGHGRLCTSAASWLRPRKVRDHHGAV